MVGIGGEGRGTLNGARPLRRRFGALLLEKGLVTEAEIESSLAAQRISGVRLGEILAARGHTDRSAIAAAAAGQRRLAFVDLARQPPDPALIQPSHLPIYLARQFLPWRRLNDRIVYVAAEPDEAQQALAHLNARAAPAEIAVAEPRAIRAALVAAFGPPLAERASERRPSGFSMRTGSALWQRRAAIGAVAGLAAAALAAPHLALQAAMAGLAGVLGLNAALWTTAIAAGRRPETAAPPTPRPENAAQLADFRGPPKISLLIPLYREPETAPLLLCALRALDYPAELLDVKLVLEAGDDETRDAIAALSPPPYVEILTTPPGGPQTKPRALNFALDFAKGDIIGVYDAEDRPAPDQLRRIAAQFAASPPEVACIQARLGFYNRRENFLTRCFDIEYASWFDVMLPGLHRLGLPIPLGGTSLFIRRGALVTLGGWDSHNVTEDADLGVMIARAGLQTALSPSVTEEEANCRPGAWIKQRSRWLKGYMATWLTHMRRPRSLIADLGFMRFVGFNIVFLGAVLGYLALPFLWAVAGLRLAVDLNPVIAGWADVIGFVALLSLPALAASAVIGLRRRHGAEKRWRSILLLPFYWPLGAVAAYLALWELIMQPFKWRKTSHGVGRIARKLRAQALSRLSEEE